MSVNVDLSRKQINALHKGKTIVLKSSQMNAGNHNLLLNDAELKRFRNAVRNNKGMKITVNNLSGSGFKDVMAKVAKQVKKVGRKGIEFAKSDFVQKEALPFAKEIMAPAIRENRKTIDKVLKQNRELTERKAENLLMNMGMPKELAQDIVTENSMMLSKKASKQLDKLEGKVDTVMAHPEMNMVKGRDYAYLNPYDVNPDGLNELPVAVAQAIPVMKGEGINRVVYLKGSGAKKFFKKVGKVLGKVVKSKPVKKILSQLATQGVSALATSLTGNPQVGKMLGDATSGLVEQGVGELTDTTGEALGGGILTMKKVELRGVSKMGGGMSKKVVKKGGALYPAGGALFVPSARRTGKGLVSPVQGGQYYI